MVQVRSKARRAKRLAFRESLSQMPGGVEDAARREAIRERRLGLRMNELRLKEFDKLTPQEKAIVIKASKPNLYGTVRIRQLRVMMEEGKFDDRLQRIRANWKK